jgi:integrase/recombinase XerD
MDELFETYLEALRRRRRAPLTIRDNQRVLAQLHAWLTGQGMAAADLDPLACERFFERLLDRYAVATIRHMLATVRAAYRYGLRHQLVELDPTVDVQLPRLPDVEPTTYTNAELRAIHAAIRSERDELLFFLLAFTGMRLSEAGSLWWEQIDRANEQIRLVGKCGKLRLVPLHPALRRVLQAHEQRTLPGQRPVIAGRHGRPLAQNTLCGAAASLTARAGISGRATSSHTFRRTVATELHEQGVPKRVIEKILGWAPRTVYERHYLRIADHPTREAILTLYRDDPICPGQLGPPTPPLRLVDAAPPAPLVGDLTRLERLERKYGLPGNAVF